MLNWSAVVLSSSAVGLVRAIQHPSSATATLRIPESVVLKILIMRLPSFNSLSYLSLHLLYLGKTKERVRFADSYITETV